MSHSHLEKRLAKGSLIRLRYDCRIGESEFHVGSKDCHWLGHAREKILRIVGVHTERRTNDHGPWAMEDSVTAARLEYQRLLC